MRLAQRLQPLQANVFDQMDRAKFEAIAQGRDLIDLSLGSSDLPTAGHILEAIATNLTNPQTHGYPLFRSTQQFRQAAADWYEQKFGLVVNPETEVMPLIGSQEGTAHLPLAVLNPGDIALLQDPGYPSHFGGVVLAGGQTYSMPADHQFFPRFGDIPDAVLSQAKLMVLSYPHNPTTAVADLDFFQEAVDFCRCYDLVLAHDFPYADLVFTGQAPSVLQANRAREVAIEFFSFSKSYNMGGFRLGYAIGNAQIIQALRQVKSFVDFNQYAGIMAGGVAALRGDQATVIATVETFRERRDTFVQALQEIGWRVPLPRATMYVWAKLPVQNDSTTFCLQLVAATGVAASPGVGFGKSGEGYVRFALVRESPVLLEAAQRLKQFLAS
jgi:aspartate/methionine/tyrosine aminotransferase